MRKMFNLKTFVMFFMAISLATSIIGCKDYDDDIDNLQEQISALKTTEIAAFKKSMESKIGALESQIAAVKAKADAATSKADIDAAKEELKNLLVTKEVFEAFKADVEAKLKAANSAGDIDAINTKVNSVEGRVILLETLLKLNDKKDAFDLIEGLDAKIEELIAKVDANKASIDALMAEGGFNQEKFKSLLAEMGLDIAAFSSNLTSLVYYPEAYVNGVEAIIFRPIVFNSYETTEVPVDVCEEPVPPAAIDCFTEIGQKVTVKEGSTTYTTQMLSGATVVSYNMNPGNLSASKIDTKNLMVTSHSAKFYTKAGGAEDAVEGNPFTVKYVGIEDGKLKVEMDVDFENFVAAYSEVFNPYRFVRGWESDGSESSEGEDNIVLALQVPQAGTASSTEVSYVTSDYTLATVRPIYGLDIAAKHVKGCDNARYPDFIGPKGDVNTAQGDIDWAQTKNAKELPDGINKYNGESQVLPKDARIVELVEGETLDLHDYVKAVNGSKRFGLPNNCVDVDVDKIGFTWEFALLDSKDKTIVYNLNNNNTNQQKFIKLDPATGKINALVYGDDPNGAAVDRTPIVRVRLKNDDCTVSTAFIKVLIVKKSDEPTPTNAIVITMPQIAYSGMCNDTKGLVQGLTTEEVNRLIYNRKDIAMSKKEFHEKYKNFTMLEGPGNVELIKDIDDGQTTYLPKWTVDPCTIWNALLDKCGKEASSAVITAKAKYSGDGVPDIILVFSTKFTKPDMNIEPADMYKKYWHEDFTYIEHHSQKPTTVVDADPNNFTYENDINAAFVNKLTTPEVLKDMEYEYVFDKDIADQITDSGMKITISDDGKELKADGELIASIKDHTDVLTGDDKSADILSYNYESEKAKLLLNELADRDKDGKDDNYFMWAKLQIKAKCDCGDDTPVSYITVNGNDGFKVRFLRPIDFDLETEDYFVDGVDEGADGSVIDVFEALALSDWRTDKFEDHDNYMDFYGVASTTFNTDKAKWDANGKLESIPTTVKLTVEDLSYIETITNGDFNYDGKDNAKDDELYKSGKGLVYVSNGSVVKEDYYLYIPVSVEYKMGKVEDKIVKILVKKTTTKE